MQLVNSVNGKTGDVVITADEIMVNSSSQNSIEDSLGQAYLAETSKISGTQNDYLLTITKGE